MNPTLIKLAQFVAKRPTDTTIRWMHILTWVILAMIFYWSQERSVIDVPFMGIQKPEIEKNIEYGLYLICLFFIIRWLVRSCLVKHNTLRIKQALAGILLIIIWGPMMDPMTEIIASTTIDSDGLPIQISEAWTVDTSWHPGVFLILIWMVWILVGATGKGTTLSCIHYGEKVNKIRV